jgi:hypothetical protein
VGWFFRRPFELALEGFLPFKALERHALGLKSLTHKIRD